MYTDGCNLAALLAHLCLSQMSTQIISVGSTFWVLKQQRQALYDEIQEVLESITVNYRHIALLVGVERARIPLSDSRHGIQSGDIGPLAKVLVRRNNG
jgi:hypothetical protein